MLSFWLGEEEEEDKIVGRFVFVRERKGEKKENGWGCERRRGSIWKAKDMEKSEAGNEQLRDPRAAFCLLTWREPLTTSHFATPTMSTLHYS